jgi:flagellar basal body-associated protein FliL
MTTMVFGYIAFNSSGPNFDINKLIKPNKEEDVLLNEFVVNLKSENNRKNYLKLQIALMCNEESDKAIIESNVNKIRDRVVNILLDKTSSDILEGDNIKNLKGELKEEINLALKDELVKEVYITDLVVQ